MMQNLSFILFSLFICTVSIAQTNPISWQHKFEKVDNKNYKLVFTANIDSGWYLYSQFLESDEGPIPTTISFDDNTKVVLVGKAEEIGEKKEGFDELFGMNIIKYGKQVQFVQKVTTDSPTTISGYIEFMTCDDHQCLPPNQVDFKFDLK